MSEGHVCITGGTNNFKYLNKNVLFKYNSYLKYFNDILN